MYTKLEVMKVFIEGLNKLQQVEVLRIIKGSKSVKINENRNGIYINMSFLEESTIEELDKYIQYITDQELMIDAIESQKKSIKDNMPIKPELLLRTIPDLEL